MSPVAQNGVDKQGVSINGVQVEQALNAANETVNKGVYAATTLSAVDADLTVGNIKDTVTIFGFLGTLAATISHDNQDSAVDTQGNNETQKIYCQTAGVGGNDDGVVLTLTLDCAQATVIEAAFFVSARCTVADALKLQMYIDGIAQGETTYIVLDDYHQFYDIGNKAVSSGNRVVYLNTHNYTGAGVAYWGTGGIFAGCPKLA